MKSKENIKVRIEGYASGGKGVAKPKEADGRVIFVNNAIPGQLVEVAITKRKRRHAEGRLVKVIERAPSEVETGFQPVAGAPFATLPIAEQHELKKEAVLQNFRRLGGIEEAPEIFDQVISSPLTWNYRNKVEYSFSRIGHDMETGQDIDGAFAFGFKHRGTWWKVESLEKASGLFDEDFENKLPQIRAYLENTGLPAWHPPRKEGFFRHMMVRKSFHQDAFMVNLVTSDQGVEGFDPHAFADFLKELEPRVVSIIHSVNGTVADPCRQEDSEVTILHGVDFLTESILGLEFKLSLGSFFQPNPLSAERLYDKGMDYLEEGLKIMDVPKDAALLDLFCGTGTIGQVMAKRFPDGHVVGVDIVEKAVHDARSNAAGNGLDNVEFHAEDAGRFLLSHPEYKGNIGGVVVDPPRAGIGAKTIRKISRLGSPVLVYISCNPDTQSRDIAYLKELGYRFEKFSLVDQFPHTGHIESVALLTRDADRIPEDHRAEEVSD